MKKFRFGIPLAFNIINCGFRFSGIKRILLNEIFNCLTLGKYFFEI